MTTPTPSALAELVAGLRADAAFYYAAGEYDKSVGYENSAKKLEAALAQPAKGDGGRVEAVAWRYRDVAQLGDHEWRYLDMPPLLSDFDEMTTQSPAADSVMDIHSCGYYCQLPKCVLRQRDELVRVYVQGWKEKEPVTVDGAGFNGMTDGGSLTYAGQRKAVEHITTELSAAIGILQKAQQRAEAIDCQPVAYAQAALNARAGGDGLVERVEYAYRTAAIADGFDEISDEQIALHRKWMAIALTDGLNWRLSK